MSAELKKTLGPVMLWGLGVGYVISGMYFGWNLGLPLGGPYGFLVATLLVTLMYITFVLSYAELACALPKAGGAFVYGNRAFGPGLGLLSGMAQCVEFVFALPAVAAAIGAYLNLFFPQVPALAIAMGAYFFFTALNIYGVKQSAAFELVVSIAAVLGVLGFAGMTLPHFSWAAFSQDALPNGWAGVLACVPYAIWFYLAIEGVANVAEETKNPQRDLARGFTTAMATLVVLAVLTFAGAVGVSGWQTVVFKPGTTTTSDSPLPLVAGQLLGESHLFFKALIVVGVVGLVASFHGIVLVAGRSILEFGRMGYAPKILGHIHAKRHTPVPALMFNMIVGFAALWMGRMGEIITISVFGALTLYILSMLAVFRLRRSEPGLVRPFRVPFYPLTPAIALSLAILCMGAMVYYNQKLALIYLGLLAGGYAWYFLFVPKAAKGNSRHERTAPPIERAASFGQNA